MNTVTVSFGSGREYELRVADQALAAQDAQGARDWLEHEFIELECTPDNPVGKLLLVDQIINVAKCAGENAFMRANGWTGDFARCTLKALDCDSVRIDTQGFTLSY